MRLPKEERTELQSQGQGKHWQVGFGQAKEMDPSVGRWFYAGGGRAVDEERADEERAQAGYTLANLTPDIDVLNGTSTGRHHIPPHMDELRKA